MTAREHVIDYIERETGAEVVRCTPDCDELVWQVESSIGDLWVVTEPVANVYDVELFPSLTRVMAEHRRVCDLLDRHAE
jgi:hypothetical protein